VEAVPRYLKWLYYPSADRPRDFTEKRFLRDVKDFDATYLWPHTSIETFRKVKQQSKPIFWSVSTALQSRQNLLLMMLAAAWESLPNTKLLLIWFSKTRKKLVGLISFFVRTLRLKNILWEREFPNINWSLPVTGGLPSASRIFPSTSQCQTRLLLSLWAVFASEKEFICCCGLEKKRELKADYCFAEVWSQQLLKLAAEF